MPSKRFKFFDPRKGNMARTAGNFSFCGRLTRTNECDPSQETVLTPHFLLFYNRNKSWISGDCFQYSPSTQYVYYNYRVDRKKIVKSLTFWSQKPSIFSVPNSGIKEYSVLTAHESKVLVLFCIVKSTPCCQNMGLEQMVFPYKRKANLFSMSKRT